MLADKNAFFKAIDHDDHFNIKTKEAYWNYFVEKCDRNIKTLFHEGSSLYPEKAGIHHYVKYSIEKFLGQEVVENKAEFKQEPKEEGVSAQPGESGISPIDSERKKETATTWGTNDDVKHK